MLLDRLTKKPEPEKRFSLADWHNAIEFFTYNGQQYSLPQTFRSWGKGEGPSWDFRTLADGAMGSSGVVFACMAVRLRVFSQVRYQFQELRGGRPGDLFGTSDLSVLERPWVGGTTGNLNARMLVHADLGGNAYVTRNSRGELRLLRPDWVSIAAVGDDFTDIDAQIMAYYYTPGGTGSGRETIRLDPSDVAHFAPEPDPTATWRGKSWLPSVARNVASHKEATAYKEKFFKNGATPNAIIKVDPTTAIEVFRAFREDFEKEYFGTQNAHKTWFLGGGADADIIGNSFQEMSFKEIQGIDETIICSAAGVPPALVGLAGTPTGGSSLNSGNYGEAKRQFADTTIAHLANEAASSLETLVPPPAGSRLWYDTRDVAFFRQDERDEAEVQLKNSQTIRNLLDAGFIPESVTAAVAASDWSLLSHSGLFSVQLQKPGSTQEPVNA